VEYVDKLAAMNEAEIRSRSISSNEGKEGTSLSTELTERKVIPDGIQQRLKMGQAIVIGKTEGQKQEACVRYVQVPPPSSTRQKSPRSK